MMKIAKKLILNNKVTSRIRLEGKKVVVLFYSEMGKLSMKYRISESPIVVRNNIYLWNDLSKDKYQSIFNHLKGNVEKMFFLQYSFLAKLHMIGLGFKNFVLDNKLYILVGDCNYIIFEIPETLKVYCRKNQIYILSVCNKEAFDFMSQIKKIKRPNFYKGKGILEFKNFKFTKLKVGKKQRFA